MYGKWLMVVALFLFATVIWARPPSRINPRTPAAPKYIDRVIPSDLPPPPPPTTDELDQLNVGTTYVDFLNIGCMARTIARDSLGGLHVVWMNARQTAGGDRVASYNFRRPVTNLWHDSTGSSVYVTPGAGYPSVGLLRGGRAIVAAHHPGAPYYVTALATDDGYQVSAFIEHTIRNSPTSEDLIWPSMAVDHTFHAQVFSSESVASPVNDNVRIFYSRSDTGGINPDTFRYAVTTLGFGANVATSRISNKVAMCWGETLIPDGYNSPGAWSGFLAEQRNNELMVVQSQNGSTWDFTNNRTNVTRTKIWNDTIYANTGDTALAAGDSLRFFNDASMIYDNQDHLHVVFTTGGLWEDPLSGSSPPIDGLTGSSCFLWHWCETNPNECDLVADGWWETNQVQSWQMTIDRPSMAIASNGDLYCVFTRYAIDDTSSNGWPCGDIWVTVSSNNGQSWYYPTNITNTPGNAAPSGQAHNECFAQVQEVIGNDSLYVLYLDDRSGGSAFQETSLSGDWTLNQIKVDAIRTTQVHRDSLISTMQFRTSAPEPIEHIQPQGFAILNNYPNPFNPTTEIRFSLEKSRMVKLTVYDLNGRQVAQLANGRMAAGQYKATFDGSKLASGVYFARLVSDGTVNTKKMTLLK